MKHEIELRADGIAARVEQHPAVSLDIAASATSDGQHCISTIIKEWSLNSDVATFQECRPETLPFGLAGRHGACALSVVSPHLMLIFSIKHRIVEPQHV